MKLCPGIATMLSARPTLRFSRVQDAYYNGTAIVPSGFQFGAGFTLSLGLTFGIADGSISNKPSS